MKLTNNLTIEQLLKTPFGHQFNIEQKSLILQAAEIGIDPMVIAKPEFNDEQMWLIIAAHKTGHDYRPFARLAGSLDWWSSCSIYRAPRLCSYGSGYRSGDLYH